MQDQILKIFEQFDRTGSSIRQAWLAPMLGLKHFRQAATTIAGIELMHRIRKGQFKLGRLGAKGNMAPKIWNAVLAA
jgi:hypothetical protein